MQFIKSHKLQLHLIVFLWGFTAILGKLITTDADSLVLYRMMLTSLCLFSYIIFTDRQKLRVEFSDFVRLLAIGGFMAAHWFCFFSSIKLANVSVALCCLSLSTLFASIIEPLVFRRKIRLYEIILGLVIVMCIVLIFSIETKFKLGIIYGILCAFCGTVFSVYNGKLGKRIEAETVIFYEIFCGAIILAIAYLIMGNISAFILPDSSNFALLVLLASVFTAYPMLQSVKLMEFISPFTLILTVNLEPVYGIVFAAIIFGKSEHMSPVFYLASLVMIGAIAVNGVLKARKKV